MNFSGQELNAKGVGKDDYALSKGAQSLIEVSCAVCIKTITIPESIYVESNVYFCEECQESFEEAVMRVSKLHQKGK